MQKKISVIVPVYNVEKYFKKSVNSILKQTYKNLEVILVDDESPDNCPKMCDEFAQKDSRVKVIHKKNGGVSSARNMGIDAATGEYIMFVDSDDWLTKNAVKALVEAMEENIADFCYGATVEIAAINNGKNNKYQAQTIYKDEAEKLIVFLEKCFLSPWSKLYKTNILKDNNIRFPLGVAYSEDTWFLLKYLQQCNKLCRINKIVYCYNEIVASSATQKYHPDIHKWHAAWIKEFKILFGESIKNKEIACYLGKYGIDCFDACCKHYVKHSDVQGGKTEVAANIRLSYESLKEYIDLFKENYFLCKDEFKLEKYNFYNKYIETNNFEALQPAIQEQRIQKQRPIKQKLRKILVKVKIFVLFGSY